MKPGILVISYDGMLEPLGQSQVLTYLERISQLRPIYLISFEKPEDLGKDCSVAAVSARMNAAGIEWHCLRYHNRPTFIATLWDIAQGAAMGLWLTVRHRLAIIQARSYVASVMALIIKRLTGACYIFDMRGFWADERVDGGLWPRNGHLYKLAKWFERRFLLRADHVVSLTYSAVRIMKEFSYLQSRTPPFTIIPTCADLQLFKPRADTKREGPFTLGYVGTVGTWYMFNEVVATIIILLRLKPEARFLVVNRGEHSYIRECLIAAGVPESAIELTSAAHYEMPALIARMHAAVFFIKPVLSKQASAPTKLAEFLGCGIPCLSNTGVGDMAELLQNEGVGIAIRSFDEASLYQGLTQLLSLCADPRVSERCVTAAQRNFSLDEGVVRYERIYKSLGA